MTVDLKTQEKIKQAARELFLQKGYDGTKTRDIAERSGINLALLNYYFKSKAQLFDLIMLETFQLFVGGMSMRLNDETSTFEQKIEQFVSAYIDLLIAQPNLPLFIMSEISRHPEELIKKVQVGDMFMNSVFIKQLNEKMAQNNTNPILAMQVLMSLLGMTIFPFIGKPLIKSTGHVTEETFQMLMLQRKELIPKWIKMILEN